MVAGDTLLGFRLSLRRHGSRNCTDGAREITAPPPNMAKSPVAFVSSTRGWTLPRGFLLRGRSGCPGHSLVPSTKDWKAGLESRSYARARSPRRGARNRLRCLRLWNRGSGVWSWCRLSSNPGCGGLLIDLDRGVGSRMRDGGVLVTPSSFRKRCRRHVTVYHRHWHTHLRVKVRGAIPAWSSWWSSPRSSWYGHSSNRPSRLDGLRPRMSRCGGSDGVPACPRQILRGISSPAELLRRLPWRRQRSRDTVLVRLFPIAGGTNGGAR